MSGTLLRNVVAGVLAGSPQPVAIAGTGFHHRFDGWHWPSTGMRW